MTTLPVYGTPEGVLYYRSDPQLATEDTWTNPSWAQNPAQYFIWGWIKWVGHRDLQREAMADRMREDEARCQLWSDTY